MSLMTIMLIIVVTVVVNLMIFVLSSMTLGSLRTVPKPNNWDLETMMMAPAEMRAGKKLQEACYRNNPKEACVALMYWAWASGEIAVVNKANNKMKATVQPELRNSIDDLWRHLDTKQDRRWFGGQLWHAFVNEHPEFTEQLQMG